MQQTKSSQGSRTSEIKTRKNGLFNSQNSLILSPPKTDAHDAHPKQDVKEAGMRMDVIALASGAITSFNLPLRRSVDGELKSFCNAHLPSLYILERKPFLQPSTFD